MLMNVCRIATLMLAMTPVLAGAAAADPSVEERLRALEERQQQLEQMIRDRDARIEQLERESAQPAPPPIAVPETRTATEPAAPAERTSREPTPVQWGAYEGGNGMVLARTDIGEVDFSVFTYIRYLNQHDLEETYTDAFGRTRELDLRNDLQFQKVTLNFKGWLFDPDFRYLFYTWTSNTSQGLSAQVVVAGNLSYRLNDHVSVGGGIGSLPSTRSTNWTFPNWLKVDHRTIADEFFRGSYTSGIWAWGEIVPGLKFRAMLGNNLSQLGVDAAQLDDEFNTISGALWWTPTGEYGPGDGLGDVEYHQEVATLFGLHFTRSREDAQSQPGQNDFENTQIRLSDGTAIFSLDPFGTGTRINKASYRMAAANAGMKYRGFSLEGEYYWRAVDDFVATGPLPRERFVDRGFQVQASAMLIPQSLQLYVAGSKIFGEFGDPWEGGVGVNWYPFTRRELKWNTQFLYLEDSPVGYTAVPYIIGSNGWVFTTDLMLSF